MAPGTTISIDGRPVATRDLKPGTEISHVHINSVQQSAVTEVTQMTEVLRVLAPNSVILRLGDGTVNRYTIPSHATFHADDGSEIPVIRSAQRDEGLSNSGQTSTMDTHSRQTTVSGSIATPHGAEHCLSLPDRHTSNRIKPGFGRIRLRPARSRLAQRTPVRLDGRLRLFPAWSSSPIGH